MCTQQLAQVEKELRQNIKDQEEQLGKLEKLLSEKTLAVRDKQKENEILTRDLWTAKARIAMLEALMEDVAKTIGDTQTLNTPNDTVSSLDMLHKVVRERTLRRYSG